MNQIKTIFQGDEDYHFKFHTIKSSPSSVFYLGDISILDKPIIAIVGPRKPSTYAIQVLDHLFEKMQNYDIVTVSGLAPGVDQHAHKLSIKYGIKTIAVLGGGIATYQSKSTRFLIDDIVNAGGLVVSEFEPNLEPRTYTFPQRNRIIAGLSDILFLPEAGKGSGSLITVDFAKMMHKITYGTPQDIFSSSGEGLMNYIQSGLIRPISDLDLMLNNHFGRRKKSDPMPSGDQTNSEEENNIIKCLLDVGVADISAIAYHFQCHVSQILPSITMLEIKNIVYQSSPGVYKISCK